MLSCIFHVDNISKDALTEKYLASETGSYLWYNLRDSPET